MAPRVKLHFLLCFDRMKSWQLAKKKPVEIKSPVLLAIKCQPWPSLGDWSSFRPCDPLDQ